MHWYLKVLKDYAVFTGRSQRMEFWIFILISTIITWILGYIDIAAGLVDPETGLGLVSAIYSLAVLIPSVAVGARRLHDIGRSGWWQLLVLIPLLGAIALIVMFALDSKSGDNKYGANPKGA